MSRGRHQIRFAQFLFLIFMPYVLLPAPAFADTGTLDEFKALGERFDHLTTGYELTGEHVAAECGDCHIGGVFQALPRECDACHDNVIAIGKPSIHVETSRPCDVCHTTSGFLAGVQMDHSVTNVPCNACHGGITAEGKSADHMPTTDICEGCHTTNFWTEIFDVDHDQVLGICVACHTPNGVADTNKGPNHMPTSDTCDACHLAIGVAWVPVDPGSVDHNHVIGACSSCHDGVIARGKGPDHVVTALECNACHLPGGAPGADPWADVSGT
ncbi:MAG: hypothetical protein PVF34_10255 [Gammaproteobacteria bacterium]|jgi:hypothetical protein